MSGLSDNVRKLRRTAGLTQESLAEAAGLSPTTVAKVEQGGEVRNATLHALARALDVPTSALFVTEATLPVGDDRGNRRRLVELRQALTPPAGLDGPLVKETPAGELPELSRQIKDGYALYQADRYDSVAKVLPSLLRVTGATVAAGEGDGRGAATVVRVQALLLTGTFLTQVRQYDLAYYAHSEAIRLAGELGQRQLASVGVDGLCWLLIRQARFDECEDLATRTAMEVEPRLSRASQGEIAAWGRLWLRASAAAIRNNRSEEAAEARRMAAVAASAMADESLDFPNHLGSFGPVTAEMKAVEDLSLLGDARGVLDHADSGPLTPTALRNFGRLSRPSWGRHRLDVARAHVTLGAHQEAMDVLTSVLRTSGEWIKHQPMARDIMGDLLKSRKRTLTREMRVMAHHLGVS
ncbi:helix-turn-helix transcriptional regulator [Streptomyces sp. DSM 44915]|uniref:Helix-turn-helix transcriptional regulator n=1 Tax=Streptomyces chisholmiae TaxID=3075540 RepID=A0ABU2JSI4_9ACTN|nr:helix-turn-helix transcriptional regulator [Streptomyces sp. DSM 44915]MDT0267942.1 helix-turn-helix transcriptional regulator [Streptomyces sp. DSM 44915]